MLTLKLDHVFQRSGSSLLFGLLVEFSSATMLKDSVEQPKTNKISKTTIGGF